MGFGKFDLSPMPSGTTAADIVKATLRLMIESVREPGTFEVESADDPWDEGSLTAITQPSAGTDFTSGPIPISEANEGKYVTVDVTSLVKKWFDGPPLDNNGIALRPFDGLRMKVGAKEGDEAHSMEIEVVLDAAGDGGVTSVSTVSATAVPGSLIPLKAIANVICPTGSIRTGCSGLCDLSVTAGAARLTVVSYNPSGSAGCLTTCERSTTVTNSLVAQVVAYCAQ